MSYWTVNLSNLGDVLLGKVNLLNVGDVLLAKVDWLNQSDSFDSHLQLLPGLR